MATLDTLKSVEKSEGGGISRLTVILLAGILVTQIVQIAQTWARYFLR
jgi:hypothetical protein